MKRILSRGAGALLLAAASLLAGCAGPFLVESNVQSFSSLPAVPSEPRYRFERLPSQQAAPMQPQLELLADPALLKFQVHQGAIERVIETRDNGVVVATTNTLAAGTYVLNQAPVGQITNSVQGDKPTTYGNTIAGLVRRIATAYFFF